MDKVMNRMEASAYIKMSDRNLSRLMVGRFVPFIKTHFSENPANGRVYFSQRKLDDWVGEFENLSEMTDSEKTGWKMQKRAGSSIELDAEVREQKTALKILWLGRRLKKALDDKNSSQSEHDNDFEEYFALIPELHSIEKQRLREFFDEDMECLFYYFPELFKDEIKAKEPTTEERALQKRIEAGEVIIEMRNGRKVERYPTLPGTKKPEKERSIQVEQIGSELTRIERIEEEEE